jgi:bacterioferritin
VRRRASLRAFPATHRRRIPLACAGVRSDPQIIEILNEVLTAELTAVNQYFVHSRMCENWGYQRLAKKKYEEAIGEMKDADAVIRRILYLEGVPNMQRLNPVRVGEDAVEQHKLDLALETDAIARLNRAIRLCHDKNDGGTRELLEHVLEGEEESADWLESQLHLVEELGKTAYLAEQIKE